MIKKKQINCSFCSFSLKTKNRDSNLFRQINIHILAHSKPKHNFDELWRDQNISGILKRPDKNINGLQNISLFVCFLVFIFPLGNMLHRRDYVLKCPFERIFTEQKSVYFNEKYFTPEKRTELLQFLLLGSWYFWYLMIH